MSFYDTDDLRSILDFLKDFQEVVMTDPRTVYGPHNIDEHHAKIKNLYEHEWNILSEKYFKNEFWPSVEILAEKGFDFDPVFEILYKELYYRHIYNKVGSTKPKDKEADHGAMSYERFKSWQNYVELFNLIVMAKEVPAWCLPPTWLWDIMDEFIYQFSQFRTFRSKLLSKTPAELSFLESEDETSGGLWGIHSVLNVFYTIVWKSKIIESLKKHFKNSENNKNNEDEDEEEDEGKEFSENEMYKYLGYFSLIGLLKFHVLTGDHQLAIDSIKANFTMDMLCDLGETEWFVTTHYYYGFALIMNKRYKEAIFRFQSALNFVERGSRNPDNMRQIDYKNDQIKKQIDNLYHLLALCVTMYPMQLEDSIEQKMRERVGEDKLVRMQSGDSKVFEEIYSKSAPRFVPLAEPELKSGKNSNFANTNLQKKVFMGEIQSQLQLPAIRRYLKLYTTMELSKLSSFLSKNDTMINSNSDMPADEATLSYLMCCKVKMAVASGEDFDKTCPTGTEQLNKKEERDDENPLPNEETGPNVDFYVDNNMVHIADTKVDSTYGKNFLKLIEQYRKIEFNASRLGVTE